MANADHLALLLKEGVDAWNAWRVKQASSVPDLSGADLHGVNLHEANFYEANLSGADLSKAYLGGGNLGRATLCGANLREADLSETYLLEANLSGVPRDNQDESSDDQDESDTGSGRRCAWHGHWIGGESPSRGELVATASRRQLHAESAVVRRQSWRREAVWGRSPRRTAAPNASECAGRPARSMWCKSTAMKE